MEDCNHGGEGMRRGSVAGNDSEMQARELEEERRMDKSLAFSPAALYSNRSPTNLQSPTATSG